MNNTIKFRQEKTTDYRETEIMLRDAFWNEFAPGCVEHYLMHNIRNNKKFISKLDIVAVIDEKIIGCVAYFEDEIQADDGQKYPILCLGPIAVAPTYQGQGIGDKLISYTCKIAKKMGYHAIILYGDPGYYSNHGFEPAKNFQIRTSENKYASVLQIRSLDNTPLKSGKYIEDEVYNVDMELVEEFDKGFPYKKKLSGTPSQLKFQKIIESQDVGIFK